MDKSIIICKIYHWVAVNLPAQNLKHGQLIPSLSPINKPTKCDKDWRSKDEQYYLPYKADNLSRETDEKMCALSLFTQIHIHTHSYTDIRISANCVTEVVICEMNL